MEWFQHILPFIFKMIESFWPDISTSEVSGKIREINSKIQISQQLTFFVFVFEITFSRALVKLICIFKYKWSCDFK